MMIDLYSGIAKSRPGRLQPLSKLMFACPANEERDVLIEKSHILIKQSVRQVELLRHWIYIHTYIHLIS